MKFRVGVLIYDEVEILDFAGPCEVFASAKMDGKPCFEVITFGVKFFPAFVSGGFEMLSNMHVQAHIPLDVVIVPGGDGVQEVLANPELRDWLDYLKSQGTRIASVCTGAFVLAELGYLNGLRATTHHEDLQDLKMKYPQIEVVEGVRFVDNGQILTAAGVSAGIDMSLHLVEQLCGESVANACRKRMEWGSSANQMF